MNFWVVLFTIYLLFIIVSSVDWELFNLNTSSVFSAYVILCFCLILIFILVKVEADNKTICIFVGLFLFTCLIGYIINSYYSIYETRTKISNRIKGVGLIRLEDATNPNPQISIQENVGFPPNTSFKEMCRILMCSTKEQLNALLRPTFAIVEHNLPNNVIYDVLWYIFICENPRRMGFSHGDIDYIKSCTDSELLNYLGQDYIGARDRASLLFSVMTGYIVPKLEYSSERYEQIKEYNPQIIYNLAFFQGNLIDEDNRSYKVCGPYVYLSSLQPSAVEIIMTQVEKENYHEIMDKLGIGPINNFSQMSREQICKYLQADISLYDKVFTRPTNMQLPPSISDVTTKEEIMHILSFYTNVELITAYEPRGKWNSRSELLALISDDVISGPKWSIHSTSYCTNEESINIVTAEVHKDINKQDKEDPTLSFGKHKNYRCYQVSELEASFDIHDGTFLFNVPDYRPGEIDAITNTPMASFFSMNSINQLHQLLIQEQNNYNVSGLIAKISTGFEFMKSAKTKMSYLKSTLEGFSYKQKEVVELYLGWMFVYSMWMRFWKGPGTPWPMAKVNVSNKRSRDAAQRSSPEERDEHIFIQDGIRTAIIEIYEQDLTLKDFLEELPTIYYDFDTLEMSVATYTIKDILDKIALGDYCMGFGSDTVLKTAYCYITCVLGYPQGKDFDGYIAKILPILTDMEYSYISTQLDKEQRGTKLKVLNERYSATSKPIPKQQSFNTAEYQNNVHTE